MVTQNVTAEFADASHATLVHTSGGDLATEIVVSDEDVYKLEFLDLFEAIRNDHPAKIPVCEGAKSLDLALAATRSRQRDRHPGLVALSGDE